MNAPTLPKAQIIRENGKPAYAVLRWADFKALREALEDAYDVAVIDRMKARITAGEEELFPAEVVDRIMDGENRVKVLRQYRGMKQRELAQAIGINAAYLSELEASKKVPSVETLVRLARALKVDLQLLAPPVD